jgi:hypothetical protein
MSWSGGSPWKARYSRLNWVALVYPTVRATWAAVASPASMRLWSDSNVPTHERLLAACAHAVERIAWSRGAESTGSL